MKRLTKRNLNVGAGVLLVLVFLGLVFPSTTCFGTRGRIVATRTLIQNFDMASRAYKAEYGSYPSGGPREVVSALAGNNPHSIVFLKLSESFLGLAGEPIDLWKTPFQLVRASDIEPPQLISAGPDKVFGTRDDVPRISQ